MKVLDLGCPSGHVFEGWFASEEDFLSQNARQLVQCPMCGSVDIAKRLSAPRLNLGPRNTELAVEKTTGSSTAVESGGPANAEQLQAAWLQLSRKIMQSAEDVGARFADEARRIHYGEADERAIRGQATPQEAAGLLEEGIAVLPLVLPETSKETLQ